MATLLDLEQTQTVSDYLSREIINKENPQKMVRLRNKLAIGSEGYHVDVAEFTGLQLREVPINAWQTRNHGCHDGAKIQHNKDENRLLIYGTTTLIFISPEDEIIGKFDYENTEEWFRKVSLCRKETCAMFLDAINLLASTPQLLWTLDDEGRDAEIFQS